MKYYIYFLLIGLCMVLVACGSQETPETEEETVATETSSEDIEKEDTEDQENEEQGVDVDKGMFNVEVTIPASLLEDQDSDQVIPEAQNADVGEIIENEDGSVTYKMSKSTHQDMMDELEKGFNESMEDIKNDEDLASIEDITTDKSFSEFTLIVNQEAFENSFDIFAIYSLAIAGVYYQLFDGADPDDYEVTVFIENSNTGEVFNTVVFPEAFEEMNNE